MTGSRNDRTHVEIRLDGHLDPHWSTWLDGLTLTQETDGTTTLRGTVADQAQLHGVLAKIRDMGATLISLTPMEDDGVATRDLPCNPSRDPDRDAHDCPDPPRRTDQFGHRPHPNRNRP